MKFSLKYCVYPTIIIPGLMFLFAIAYGNEGNSKFELFPVITGNTISVGLILGGGITLSQSNIIQSNSFISRENFKPTPFFGLDGAKIRYKNSDIFYPDHPVNYHYRLAIDVNYHTNYTIDFRFNVAYDLNREVLYSEKKLLYLDNDSPEEFIERTIVYNDETLIKPGAGLLIQILGSSDQYLGGAALGLQQYLSLYLGFSVAVPLSSSATQYLQIKNNNDILRYKNGSDTLRIIDNRQLVDINFFRSYFDAEIGWFVENQINFGISAYYSYQLNSILENSNWKQWICGIKLSFYVL